MLDTRAENIGHHALFLVMESRIPDKLGFKMTVGPYNDAGGNTRRQTSSLVEYSEQCWDWSYAKLVKSSDLTVGKVLCPDGKLQIKIKVFNPLPAAVI